MKNVLRPALEREGAGIHLALSKRVRRLGEISRVYNIYFGKRRTQVNLKETKQVPGFMPLPRKIHMFDLFNKKRINSANTY